MRLHLILGLLTALLLIVTLRGREQHRFTFEQVQALAEQRAGKPYVPLSTDLPPQLKNLTVQQEDGIFWDDKYRIWRNKGLPFQIDFFHVNKLFPSGIPINLVDRKGAHPLAYAPAFFHFSGLTFNPPLPNSLGFSGFYLRYPINKPDSLDGFFAAQGADYFRVIAAGQAYGVTARGIAINTILEKKQEEFPNFVEWWLHEPAQNASEMTLDALLDGPSVTGAYEFTLHPGSSTTVDIHAVLYFRQAVDRLGIAPLTSMYLFGENAKLHFGDNFHPEVHDSDGVLINKSNGEWLWRPLGQASFDSGRMLQIYDTPDENPKGYGLLQRDRDFQHYQDPNDKYNLRPSAWVTPHGNWGKGNIQLSQLPSDNSDTDNVVLFWRPDQEIKAGTKMDISYTINYYMNDANLPPLGYASATYILCPPPSPPPPPPPTPIPPGKNGAASKAPPKPPVTAFVGPPAPTAPAPPKRDTIPVRFVIDFKGDGLENIPPTQPPHLDLSFVPKHPDTYLIDSSVEKIGDNNAWRVTFTFLPFKHFTPTQILCHLSRDDKPLTETWSYTWHQ